MFALTPVAMQVFMAVSACALLAFNSRLFDRTLSAPLLFASFCGVLGFYILDSSASRNPEDRINKYQRWLLFKEHDSPLAVAGIALVVAAGAALLTEIGNETQTFVLASLGVLAWFYSSRGLNKARRVPYLKTFWVALTWTAAAILIPLTFGRLSPRGGPAIKTLLLASFNFVWLFIDTLILDWRDRHGDRAHGIRTIPQIFSHKSTAIIVLALSLATTLASLVLLWTHSELGAVPSRLLIISSIQLISLFAAVSVQAHSHTAFELFVMSWRLAMVALLLF